jgi:hypothetical protein
VKNSNTALHPTGRQALEARIGLRLAARLSERSEQVDPDISERLRFAREKALERARAVSTAAAGHAVVSGGPSAVLGGTSNWWMRFASALPVVALAAGLALIQHWHTQAQIETAAEVDADLLADDLPPTAYSDAGFVEFLKTPRE